MGLFSMPQLLLVLLVFMPTFNTKATEPLNSVKIISALKSSYGERASKRGQAWFKIMNQNKAIPELEKLEKVNRFFNLFRFIDVIKLWGLKNYWATPVEFIGVNGGDCEDYSIAKYFTLLELGVAEEKMRITMVKAIKLNQYHMVLAYYEAPSSVPLILDNIDGEIKPGHQRRDLLPVYSFNGKQLWLNKQKGKGIVAGKSSRLKRWNNLRSRLNSTKLKQPRLRME